MEVAARDTRALASGQVSLGSLFGYARRLSNTDKPTAMPIDKELGQRYFDFDQNWFTDPVLFGTKSSVSQSFPTRKSSR